MAPFSVDGKGLKIASLVGSSKNCKTWLTISTLPPLDGNRYRLNWIFREKTKKKKERNETKRNLLVVDD